MNLLIGSLMLLLFWRISKANVIPQGQSNEEVMPSVYPKVQAESYSYVTPGAYAYDDCGSTTIGHLGNGGMLRFDNVDVGVSFANHIRVRYSNQASGARTTIELYTENPALGGPFIATVNAVRTNDWCDLAEVTAEIETAIKVRISRPIAVDIQTLYLLFNTDPNSAGCDIDC
ncbi:hypothetical protein CHUAL_008839 [Chamberlinius hualienensis]